MRPRLGTVAALAVTAAVGVGMTAAADAHYEANRSAVRAIYLPADPSWVDAAGSGPVTLLVAPRSVRGDLHTTLFWNRSVQRLVLLDDAASPDPFAAPSADVDDAGHLVGTTGLVLADTYGSSVVLRNAVRLAAGPTKTLWRPRSTPQLQLTMTGRYFSGALSGEGEIRVWPEHAGGELEGWLELDLSAPSGAAPLPFQARASGRAQQRAPHPRGTGHDDPRSGVRSRCLEGAVHGRNRCPRPRHARRAQLIGAPLSSTTRPPARKPC